ncbi:MAG: hypothetical protein AAFV95_19080 [Bacteroidota bacterium]
MQSTLIRNRIIDSVKINFIRIPALRVISLISSVVTARVLGPELLGILKLITAHGKMLSSLSDLGITKTLQRILSELSVQFGNQTALQSIRLVVTAKVLLSALAFGIYLAVIQYRDSDYGFLGHPHVLFVALVLVNLLYSGLLDIRKQEWTASFRNKELANLEIIAAIATPLLIIGTVMLSTNPFLVFAASITPNVLLLVWLSIQKGFDLDQQDAEGVSSQAVRASIKDLLKRYWRHALSTYVIFVLNKFVYAVGFTVIFLEFMGYSTAILGKAAIGASVIQLGWDVANIPLANLRVPLLARLSALDDQEKFVLTHQLMVIILVMASAAVCIGLASFGGIALEALYGSDYAASIREGVVITTLALSFNIFSLGNAVTRQINKYWIVWVGAICSVLFMIGFLYTYGRTAAESDVIFVVLINFVLGRGVFWMITDVGADVSRKVWQVIGVKLIAFALVLGYAYLIYRHYPSHLLDGCLLGLAGLVLLGLLVGLLAQLSESRTWIAQNGSTFLKNRKKKG